MDGNQPTFPILVRKSEYSMVAVNCARTANKYLSFARECSPAKIGLIIVNYMNRFDNSSKKMQITLKFSENWKPLVCFLVHLFLLWAVFDTYYKSPLVHGMRPYGEMADDISPASRLVLFVADGLRAHSLFEDLSRAPFLKKIISQIGTWGVSHTRVPTESRPGHVALIAGFYEDVSAVMKGWQENPVEFDSVFNQSRYTWSWGSPDILPMFAKGASGQRVFTYCYDSASEDFASSDPSKLDTWVFEKVKEFFAHASNDTVLLRKLRQPKIVFFLHLLGLDTSGHGYKPLSPEYLKNIRIVDEGVAAVYELVEHFYDDSRTSYVFSSDHGMTDWGSHGSGDAHETMTPFVAWGAGIPTPTEYSNINSVDLSPTSGINARKDVDQADVAPLMSALLGINMPANSVGILPLNYLNASRRYRATVACSNFRQLAEQMDVQRRRKYESSIQVLFKDFPGMTPSKSTVILNEMDKLFDQKRYALAENICQQWSRTAVDGLLYYHQYERGFLSFCVAVTFLFLLLCIWRFAGEAATGSDDDSAVSKPSPIFVLVAVQISIIFWIYSFPLLRYLYGLVPLYLAATARPLWTGLWMNLKLVLFNPAMARTMEIKRLLVSISTNRRLIHLSIMAIAIELLVRSFFYRWTLSIGLWMLMIWPASVANIERPLRVAWMFNCVVMSVFPFLPTVGKSGQPELIFYTCVLIGIGCVLAYVVHIQRSTTETDQLNHAETAVFSIIFLFIMASGCINLTTSISLEQRRGSPAINRLLSWLILIFSPVLALFVRRYLWIRLITVASALFCPLTLMSTSYEPIFYACLCGLLYLWLKIESKIELDHTDSGVIGQRPLNVDDARRAYFFVFFVFLSFFGTGNIASVNSFDPSFTATFVTVFSPFVMGALLLTKIAIPFFVVCSFLCGLEATTSRSVDVLFWLIVIISDGMALRFFFLLRDQGSWLDIGSSISHFVISTSTTLIVMILYQFAKLVLTKSLIGNEDNKRHIL